MPPPLLARYQDPVEVGAGATGRVYRATDAVLGRTVAVKVLDRHLAADEETRRRFLREAVSASALQEVPGVVRVLDVGEADGRPFIVMEHLPGGSLAERLQGALPSPAVALGWLGEVAATLDRAHARGVVHRDLTPRNLLFDAAGHLHVADFGLARVLAAPGTRLTTTGVMLGSVGYLAPEAIEGQPVGPGADRYSLGVVGYEVLTGTRPFARERPGEELSAQLAAPLPSAAARRPGLPAALDPVLARALARDPALRPATCAELVAELGAALAHTDVAPRAVAAMPAAPARIRPRPGRRAAAVAGAVVVLGAGATVWALSSFGGGGTATTSAPRGQRDYDCADFRTQAEARRYLLVGDPYGLDADSDGVPCESLPPG